MQEKPKQVLLSISNIFRHVDKAGLWRFIRYSVVGMSTFTFDLLLIFLFIEFVHMQYLVATALAFVIAVSLNFIVSRYFIFDKTKRPNHHSYAYFISIAGLGLFLVTAFMYVFVDLLSVHYLIARVVIAIGVGTFNYLMHLTISFNVVGKH